MDAIILLLLAIFAQGVIKMFERDARQHGGGAFVTALKIAFGIAAILIIIFMFK